ncbi:hypothetical protein COCCADRAFT_42121 [Bipolaris zeicola 26-R-13]|uniref:GIY-YIG domain-containing protein n=1 Tax=Cochliobolus carbonum (strain 26-R-13) TaxID=930089 RepID=W6XNC0_COCC2|nr:uncharacterized protein COCCADRAFT_42121 [Bipolaris zeicola 26-R-13]EUC27003.1 hypothetical protein COCCADRAFT_42121 [Bipolaris zeicola 26-R-13]
MEEKLSLKPINYTPKRFHRINSQIRMGLTSTFISNTPFIGKRCLSSSYKLNDRFRRYFNHSYLSSSQRGASLICNALLKHGYVGFRLEILEYCPISILLDREQFYIDNLNPEYNILKTAGSNLGYKHTEPSLKLMSIASKSRNELEEVIKLKREVMLGRKLSKDHLENMAKNNPFRVPIILSNLETDSSSSSNLTNSRQAVLITNDVLGITKEFSTMKAAYQFLGISHKRLLNCKGIEVTNINTNEVIKYSSLSSAAEAIGISPSSISTAFSCWKRTTSFRGIYLFKLI